jgi:hypothetical protein
MFAAMFAAIDRAAINVAAAGEHGAEFVRAVVKVRDGIPITPREEFVLLPIKWSYDVPPAPAGAGAGMMDQARRGAEAVVAAVARRNPLQYSNIAELPMADDRPIYLIFTEIYGTRSCGLTVSKEKAIEIANWVIKILGASGEPLVNGVMHELARAADQPLAAGRGGGKRRKRRKTHKRKTQTHRRKTHRRKRTRRGR